MPGLSSIFLKPFALGRSVRGRLTATLCYVIVPAILVALGWAWHENDTARMLRVEAARHDTALAARDVNALLRLAWYFGSSIANHIAELPTDAERCTVLNRSASSQMPPGWDATILSGDRAVCGPSKIAPEPAALAALRAQLARGADFGIVAMPGEPRGAVMGIALKGRGDGLFLLALPPESFWETGRYLPEGAIELVIRDPNGAEIERSGRGPLAAGSPRSADTSSATDARREWTIAVPVAGSSQLIVAYPASRFPIFDSRIFWITAAALLSALIVPIAIALFAIDWTIGRWIGYLARIAVAHSKGRLSVRARRLDEAPRELADLGRAINRMADHSSDHAGKLETAVREKERTLKELHHRVKNNFQIVSSLLTLQRKSLPPERGPDFRFIEDHVHAMAAAYRTAFTSADITLVSPAQVAKDIIVTLGQTAGLRASVVDIRVDDDGSQVDLDKAINIGLTLAYLLPPRLDAQKRAMKPVKVDIRVHFPTLSIGLQDVGALGEELSGVGQRLAQSYVRQLQVTVGTLDDDPNGFLIHIPLNGAASVSTA